MNTYLYDYVEKNYKSVYDEISDAYVENLIETNEKNEIIDILKKKYKQKEEVFINCCMIDTKLELIYLIKKALNYPKTLCCILDLSYLKFFLKLLYFEVIFLLYIPIL